MSAVATQPMRARPGGACTEGAVQELPVQAPLSRELAPRVARLARALTETLCELGLAGSQTEAGAPEAPNRPGLAAQRGVQAAAQTLNALGQIAPLQQRIGEGATALALEWRRVLASPSATIEDYRGMARRMLDFLSEVPVLARTTHDRLNEIALAQQIQSSNAKAIERFEAIVHAVEQELASMLADACGGAGSGEAQDPAAGAAALAEPAQAHEPPRRPGS